MNDATVINISIEIFASILSLFFLICVLISDTMKSRMNRAFVMVLLSNIAVMLSDALSFYSIGKAGPFFAVTNYVGNYCTYLFSYLLIMAFSYYLYIYISSKANVGKAALYAVMIVQGIAIVLSVVALFNQMYFYIDENNVYHRQSLYWLSQMVGMAGMLINAGVIVYYRKYLNRMEGFALACYIVLPVIAIVIQTLVYGLVSVYIASTITIMIIYVGMQAQQAKIILEKEVALSESRIAIMRSQIQPHFLYNVLTSINQLCAVDPRKAQDTVGTFSEYLRGNLDSLSQRNLIPFQKELEHVGQYLELEKLRFNDKLTVEYELCAENFSLPALTLQPLVENAVHHGVMRRREGGKVTIKTGETEQFWCITVVDDGVGFDPSKPKNDGRSHIGIENARERLKVLCGGVLSIESETGTGTRAQISLPKEGQKL